MITGKFPLESAAERFSDSPALISDKQVLSFIDLQNIVDIQSAYLSDLGISGKERVAILSENTPEYVILVLALERIGAVAVSVSIRFPEKQILSSLKDVNCSRIFISDMYFQRLNLPGIKKYNINDTLIEDSPRKSNNRVFDIESPASVIFTSGSSGGNKAVIHSFRNHIFSAIGANSNISFDPGDKWLLTLPLYHIGGFSIIYRSLIGGGAVVISSDKNDMFLQIRKHGISHLSLVYTQLRRLLEEDVKKDNLKGLKAIVLGGSSVEYDTIKEAYDSGLPVHTSYGNTEMCSQVTTSPVGSDPEVLKTSGRLLESREMSFSEENEILLRGNTLCSGYLKNDKVVDIRDTLGWYHSGDIGYLDEKNCLVVQGRKDNMFTSGGENIHPEEIEQYILAQPGILQAVVVPVEDKEFGYRPAAFIKMQEGILLNEEFLTEILLENLPRFKIPVRFLPFPEVNINDSFKPDREALKTLAEKIGEY
ncbi:o-succinylbenzoate--CoA ligase [candidate division KSB1 bacterium]